MILRRGLEGSGGSGRIQARPPIPSSETRATGTRTPSIAKRDQFVSNSPKLHPELYVASNIRHQALYNAGIHLDNAKATLQILPLDGADPRAILMDVSKSLIRAERELTHAYQGSIRGDAHGKSATYDFHQIQQDLSELRRIVMRNLHTLTPVERTPILNILNSPFELPLT